MIVCDRCKGQALVAFEPKLMRDLTMERAIGLGLGASGHAEAIDLCEACLRELRAWLSPPDTSLVGTVPFR